MIKQLKDPFNLVSLILAVISIFLSIYFYQKSVRTKAIAYNISSPLNKIFDAENTTSKITLRENDSIIVKDNVYLLTCKFWNSGDQEIPPADVRKPIVFSLSATERILDFKIINQKEPGISNFKIVKVASNQLSLGWDYLDPGFAVAFQILYAGKSDYPNITVSGRVLGIANFKQISQPPVNSKLRIVTVFAYSIMFLFTTFRAIKRKKDGYAYWHWTVMAIFMLGFTIYLFNTSNLFTESIPF